MPLLDILRKELENIHLGVFDSEEQQRRADMCISCENFIQEGHKCKLCGCSVSHLVLLMQNSCKAGKWIGKIPNGPIE